MLCLKKMYANEHLQISIIEKHTNELINELEQRKKKLISKIKDTYREKSKQIVHARLDMEKYVHQLQQLDLLVTPVPDGHIEIPTPVTTKDQHIKNGDNYDLDHNRTHSYSPYFGHISNHNNDKNANMHDFFYTSWSDAVEKQLLQNQQFDFYFDDSQLISHFNGLNTHSVVQFDEHGSVQTLLDNSTIKDIVMTSPLMCVLGKPVISQQRDTDYFFNVKWETLSSFGENAKSMRIEMRRTRVVPNNEIDKNQTQESESNNGEVKENTEHWVNVCNPLQIEKNVKENKESCLTTTLCAYDHIRVRKGTHYDIRVVIDCMYPIEHQVVSNEQQIFMPSEPKSMALTAIYWRGHYHNYVPENMLVNKAQPDKNRSQENSSYYASALNEDFVDKNENDWIILKCANNMRYNSLSSLHIQTSGDSQAPKIIQVEVTDEYSPKLGKEHQTRWYPCEPREIHLKAAKKVQQIKNKWSNWIRSQR